MAVTESVVDPRAPLSATRAGAAVHACHQRLRDRVRQALKRWNLGALALALALSAAATLVTSFTLSAALLVFSVAIPVFFIGEGLRCWSGYLRSGRGTRLRATLTVLGIASYVYTLGLLWFVSATHRLAVHGWLGFDPNRAPSLARFGDVYLYHFADMIPLVSVPKTARWSEPLAHGHIGMGVMVLMFEALIIVPLIAIAKVIWERTSGAEDGSSD